jgi:hypothetical protein
MPGHNPLEGTSSRNGVAGFVEGFLHGLILPANYLLGLIFEDEPRIYEVHNNGHGYNFGFFLGLLMWPGIVFSLNKK